MPSGPPTAVTISSFSAGASPASEVIPQEGIVT